VISLSGNTGSSESITAGDLIAPFSPIEKLRQIETLDMAETELLEANGGGEINGPASGSVRLNNNCISKDNIIVTIQDSRELKSTEIQTCTIETQTMVNGTLENGIPGLGDISDEDNLETSENKVRMLVILPGKTLMGNLSSQVTGGYMFEICWEMV
jgi:hypothetical protein